MTPTSEAGRQRAGPAERPTLRWSAADLAALAYGDYNQAAPFSPADAAPDDSIVDVWDAWPLAGPDGTPVDWHGGELWFALAVPKGADPEQRHHTARIHHFHRLGDRFHHLGQTLPEGHSPGSREWSGSAMLEDGRATLYFTATGHRGERSSTFHQRIFAVESVITAKPDAPFAEWSQPVELIRADSRLYRPANQDMGEPGKIKAFRDPAFFRDDDGTDCLLFTGSSALRPGSHDGVIGWARKSAAGAFELMPPLLDATETSNELERPHIVRHAGQLYLFWCTQRGVFAPGITAPTGLYGAVSDTIDGPWTLLNGHGLVFANPMTNPTQAYSWWVLPDLSVTSFVDYWKTPATQGEAADNTSAQFGGNFAPFAQIELDGTTAQLAKG